jgi:hypothetical protein
MKIKKTSEVLKARNPDRPEFQTLEVWIFKEEK